MSYRSLARVPDFLTGIHVKSVTPLFRGIVPDPDLSEDIKSFQSFAQTLRIHKTFHKVVKLLDRFLQILPGVGGPREAQKCRQKIRR